MQTLKVADLIPHPQNDYFFDDIQGESWDVFLESVKTSGIIEPIVVNQDKIIISGHQRVRACKVLGIDEINAEIRIVQDEDEILKQLLETNIRQRGIGNTNPVKMGKCLKELERIYGIRRGGDRKSKQNNFTLITEDDLANQTGMTRQTIQNYKQLADMIPEIQDLVDTGVVSKTTALAIVRQLPEAQQKELAEQLSGSEKKVSQREVQKYINLLAEKDRRIKELENREPEVKTVVKEVVPNDYREAKSKAKAYDAETRRLNQKLTDAYNEQNELKEEIRNLQEQTVREQTNNDFVAGAIYFTAQCGSFIRDVGGYVWIADKLADLPERDRVGYIKSAMAVRDWATILLQNIERSEYGKQEVERISLESKQR